MLIYHYDKSKHGNVIFMSEASRKSSKGLKLLNISDVQEACDAVSILPFLHACSGCGTTSATYGHGKKSILHKVSTSKDVQANSRQFHLEGCKQEQIGEEGIQLFKLMYSCTKDIFLNSLRYTKYMDLIVSQNIKVLPEKLPPTERAAYFHSIRVYLQVRKYSGHKSVFELTPDYHVEKIFLSMFSAKLSQNTLTNIFFTVMIRGSFDHCK